MSYLIVVLGLANPSHKDVQIVNDFDDPSLLVSLHQGLLARLGHDPDAAADDRRL